MSLLKVGWRYVGLSSLLVPVRSKIDSYVTELEDLKGVRYFYTSNETQNVFFFFLFLFVFLHRFYFIQYVRKVAVNLGYGRVQLNCDGTR